MQFSKYIGWQVIPGCSSSISGGKRENAKINFIKTELEVLESEEKCCFQKHHYTQKVSTN